MGRRGQRTLVAALCVAASGCYAWTNPYFTNTEPAVADLIGRYRLTQGTVARVEKLNSEHFSREGYLELRRDHSFVLMNFPDLIETGYLGVSKNHLDCGKGTWAMEPDADTWKMAIEFDSSGTLENCAALCCRKVSRTLFLLGHRGPYMLMNYLSDPDEDKELLLELSGDPEVKRNPKWLTP